MQLCIMCKIFEYLEMKVQLILFERESKQLQKSLFLFVSVHVGSKNEKRKGWNHMCWMIIINHLWKKNIDKKAVETKSVFFSETKEKSKELNQVQSLLHRAQNMDCPIQCIVRYYFSHLYHYGDSPYDLAENYGCIQSVILRDEKYKGNFILDAENGFTDQRAFELAYKIERFGLVVLKSTAFFRFGFGRKVYVRERDFMNCYNERNNLRRF